MNKNMKKSGITLIVLIIVSAIVITVCAVLLIALVSAIKAGASEENGFKSELKSYSYDLSLYLAKLSTEYEGANFNNDLFFADANEIMYNNKAIEGNIYDIIPKLENSSYKKIIKISKGKIDITATEDKDLIKWAIETLGDELVYSDPDNIIEDQVGKQEEVKDTRYLGEGTSDRVRAMKEKIPYVPTYLNYVDGTKIDTGYIVYDNNGNEYVWIPLIDESVLDRQYFGDTKYDTEDADRERIFKSIKDFGGFFVARYEASMENRGVVSKPNRKPLNNVSWGANMGDIGTDSAYAYSHAVSANNKYGDIASNLLYKEQWDAILKFIDKESETSSYKWGNYINSTFSVSNNKAMCSLDNGKTYSAASQKVANKSVLYTTGATNTNCIKEMYDLAGNLAEITMGGTGNSRMAVGGDYKTLSSDQSINTIININPSQKYDNVGFRFALYVLQ